MDSPAEIGHVEGYTSCGDGIPHAREKPYLVYLGGDDARREWTDAHRDDLYEAEHAFELAGLVVDALASISCRSRLARRASPDAIQR